MTMRHFTRIRFLSLAVITVCAFCAETDPKSTNNLPNPFKPVEGWAQLPAGMEWGPVIADHFDPKGNLWVFHRKDPPILEFDHNGKFIKSFGAGMFNTPHGLTV